MKLRLVLTLLTTLIVLPALAHDHAKPGLDKWFKGLHTQNNTYCCDGAEALHLADVEWVTQDKKDSHFRVKIPATVDLYEKARHGQEVDTIWMDVPDYAVLTEPNKEGTALVWPTYGYIGPSIRCFMPGTET